MTAAIGRALAWPRAPTSALAAAPIANCSVPMNAEAEPARRPERAIARATALGKMKPRLPISRNSSTTRVQKLPGASNWLAASASPTAPWNSPATPSIRRESKRRSSAALICDDRIRPKALAPNRIEKVWAETPCSEMNTKGEAVM